MKKRRSTTDDAKHAPKSASKRAPENIPEHAPDAKADAEFQSYLTHAMIETYTLGPVDFNKAVRRYGYDHPKVREEWDCWVQFGEELKRRIEVQTDQTEQ